MITPGWPPIESKRGSVTKLLKRRLPGRDSPQIGIADPLEKVLAGPDFFKKFIFVGDGACGKTYFIV